MTFSSERCTQAYKNSDRRNEWKEKKPLAIPTAFYALVWQKTLSIKYCPISLRHYYSTADHLNSPEPRHYSDNRQT